MNILVVGSTGPQGREFVAQALGAGHAVRAFARDPSALQSAPGLEVVSGDVFDPPSLNSAVHGQDAAVVILGVSFAAARKPTNVFSQGTRNLITALKAAGVRRLIVVSSFGVGDSGRDAGILERVFFALLVRGAYATRTCRSRSFARVASITPSFAPTRLTMSTAPAATLHTSALVRSLRRLHEPTSPVSSWMRSAPASTLARRFPSGSQKRAAKTATCLSVWPIST